MWYLMSMDEGIVETASTKRFITLNHKKCERDILVGNKRCYHVIDENNDYYLFSSKKQAIQAGFDWAF